MTKPKRNPVLKTRELTYGSYQDNAQIIQALKFNVRTFSGWSGMSAAQKQSIDMIFTKIGRIITGDPDHLDSWIDIKGYAELIEEIIVKEQKKL